MSEMIERVAKAICCPSGVCQNTEVKYAICQKHTFMVEARAAIEAMREPTQAMIEAWSDASPGDWRDDSIYTDENCARADWQAMLDAALKG